MSLQAMPETQQQPIVEARRLCKSHRMAGTDVEVLSGATLTIRQGEFVAIVGPSGSGKSTLLSLLGTLDAPTSGELLIEGVATATLDANELALLRNSRIGFVFQNFHLLPRTAAIDQVTLPALYSRRGRSKAVEADALQRLRDVGLVNHTMHTPTQLSGGQQQRVAIARALVNNPRLILADEPTGALDQVSGRGIMDLFACLNATGITIVVVTHDAAVASYARRILRMQDGRIVYDGPSLATAAKQRASA
jgi:putative ABC transport system ATP-binding protein